MAQAKPAVVLTAAEEMELIQKKAKHFTLERTVQCWLNTGNPMLNSVLGSREFGLAYGKMIEIYGPESHGKTMLSLLIAALAQKDGAKVGWMDLENSLDKAWVEAQGLVYDEVRKFKLKILTDKKASKKQDKDKESTNGDGVARLETAQELFEEVELWMAYRKSVEPEGKILIVVDSVAAVLTEEEIDAGTTGQNMRTMMSLPSFLSKTLKKWVALAENYNAMIIFINQVRMKPGVKFGNPEYTPGGKAAKHYCSVRASVRRVKGGRIKQGQQTIGLRGIITNIKNKAGGGSVEGNQCGYETFFNKKRWRFPSVAQTKKEADDE